MLRPIYFRDLNVTFPSVKRAAEMIGVSVDCIRYIATRKGAVSKDGFQWCYADEIPDEWLETK